MLGIYDFSLGQYQEIERNVFYDFVNIKYDEDKKLLLINQKQFGSGVPLYFIPLDEKVYICDSLIRLKKESGVGFVLNKQMLPYFFYNGFLPGVHTLVKGVYKLPPKKTVEISRNGIHVKDVDTKWTGTEFAEEELLQRYQAALEAAVAEGVAGCGNEEICMAISAGYDSNLLLHTIRKMYPDRKVNTFSVGGIHGIDETGRAEEITKFYRDITFYKAEVSPETLKNLDDIVYRLEGSVYERGIFLQYELAKSLQQKHCMNMICGECADQVFHEKTYTAVPVDTFLYGYKDTPYEMASYVVLRKSAMMLKSFGIKGIYPFLDPEVIQIGYITRKANGDTKEFHKKQCRRMLDQRVLERIEKQGGTTSLAALFEDGYDCKEKLKNCKFYDPFFRITQKYTPQEAEYDYYLSLLYLESFERQFCDYE